MRFDELGLKEGLLEAISYMGFETATPIQEKSIPVILEGKDLIACAQTGTGKTGAFLLPMMNNLIDHNNKSTSALIICPTRELAKQIEEQIQGFSYFCGLTSFAIYGGGDGMSWEDQKNAFKQNTDIIVATPGKLISHLNMGHVNFSDLKYLILDEADRMMDMGFHDDIQKIISYLPKERQTLMFSATMPPNIRKLASKSMVNPEEISIAVSKPAEGVLQLMYLAHDHQKTPLIVDLIKEKEKYSSIIIFSSTKKKVSSIARSLKREGLQAAAISSDLDQTDREAMLSKFRARKLRIVVATDVLSRGIDIKDINLVINYDVPSDAEDYVHRIGRTARADTTGVAITLINEEDMYKIRRIEKLIEKSIMKLNVPAELGESPVWQENAQKKRSYGGSRGGSRGGNRNNRNKRGGSGRNNRGNSGNRRR